MMGAMASQITGISIVCSTVCSDADQRKHQSSASLAFVRGIHRWPVNFPHKRPVTRKMFPFDDVIMNTALLDSTHARCLLSSTYHMMICSEFYCILLCFVHTTIRSYYTSFTYPILQCCSIETWAIVMIAAVLINRQWRVWVRMAGQNLTGNNTQRNTNCVHNSWGCTIHMSPVKKWRTSP